jgi:hypothetical protein
MIFIDFISSQGLEKLIFFSDSFSIFSFFIKLFLVCLFFINRLSHFLQILCVNWLLFSLNVIIRNFDVITFTRGPNFLIFPWTLSWKLFFAVIIFIFSILADHVENDLIVSLHFQFLFWMRSVLSHITSYSIGTNLYSIWRMSLVSRCSIVQRTTCIVGWSLSSRSVWLHLYITFNTFC